MCVGNWRLGKLIRTEHRQIAIAAGNAITIAADPNRVGFRLSFEAPAASAATIVWAGIGGAVVGFVNGFNNTFKLSMDADGDLQTQTIVLTSVAYTGNIGVTLYTLPERYLRATIEEFTSKYNL